MLSFLSSPSLKDIKLVLSITKLLFLHVFFQSLVHAFMYEILHARTYFLYFLKCIHNIIPFQMDISFHYSQYCTIQLFPHSLLFIVSVNPGFVSLYSRFCMISYSIWFLFLGNTASYCYCFLNSIMITNVLFKNKISTNLAYWQLMDLTPKYWGSTW